MKEEKTAITEEDKPLESGEEPADAGQKEADMEEKTGPVRMSWEDILSDPEYKSQYDASVQSIIRKRLRDRQDAEEKLRKLTPVLTALGETYNVDSSIESLNAEALASLITDAARQRQAETGDIMRHLEMLLGQAEELRESFPGFDLMSELDDPAFLRLTAPHTGVSLSDAYYALHRDEIGRRAARSSLEALSRSLRTSGMRPKELMETKAAAGFSNDPASMSKEEREALKKRIYEAKAQGVKITL